MTAIYQKGEINGLDISELVRKTAIAHHAASSEAKSVAGPDSSNIGETNALTTFGSGKLIRIDEMVVSGL